jgi:hypothetical protein
MGYATVAFGFDDGGDFDAGDQLQVTDAKDRAALTEGEMQEIKEMKEAQE